MSPRDVVQRDRDVDTVVEPPLDLDRLLLVAQRRARIVPKAGHRAEVGEVLGEAALISVLARQLGGPREMLLGEIEIALGDGDIAEQTDAPRLLVAVAQLAEVREPLLEQLAGARRIALSRRKSRAVCAERRPQ